MSETVKNETEKKEKKLTKGLSWKQWGIVGAAVAAIALIVGVFIYNSPENRVKRQLDLGYKYLENQQYEEAVVAFEQAIAIDERCIESYLGGITAYRNLDEPEAMMELYERALVAAGELDENGLAENKDFLIEIFLAAEDVYGEDLEKRVEALKKGVVLTKSEPELVERLIEECFALVDKYIGAGENAWSIQNSNELMAAYEKAVKVLTEVYELTKDERIHKKLEEVQVAFERLQDWIAYMSQIEDVLVRIAAYCQKEDFEGVFGLMQSEEYGKLLERIDEVEEIHGMDTEYGKIGIYKVESELFGNYMLYYGEYEGDSRQGQGLWLGYYNKNNFMAKGSWEDDLPKGEFLVREWSGILAEDVVYRVISGNVDNGLWNGDVLWKFEEKDGTTQTFPVSFVNGSWVVLRYTSDGTAVVSEGALESDDIGIMVTDKEDYMLGIIGFGEDY